MIGTRRRFEVAFPYRDKNYKDVPQERFDNSVRMIKILFGGYNCQQRIGYWKKDKKTPAHLEMVTFITTDVENTDENKQYFQCLKKVWTGLLNQEEMYIATYEVAWF